VQQGLVLQRLVEKPPNWKPWTILLIIWFVLGLWVLYTDLINVRTTHFLEAHALFWPGLLYIVAIVVEISRYNNKKKCVMLEAKGEYEKAMVLATKYADPQLITIYRQRYASQLAQEIKTQPTQSNNSEQSASVINIHNTEINVQDSVVTDWNQR
jgi:hypothetical protein